MSNETPAIRAALKKFVNLSSALTGYKQNELWGTGMAEMYLDKLEHEVGPEITAALFQYIDDPAQLLKDARLGPVARALIKLWYLGQWCVGQEKPGEAAFAISPSAYTQSLAWRAMGGHPQGARQQGFASWATPPVETKETE